MMNIRNVEVSAGAEDTEPAQIVTLHGDRIAWGPIWAGLVTTFSLYILLELLFYGLGVLELNREWNVWFSALLGLVSFFIGGWLCSSSSGLRGGRAGSLNGFLVWALATVVMLTLSAVGLGTAFGAAGGAFSGLAQSGQAVLMAHPAPAATLSHFRDAAWAAFSFLILAAIASSIGGYLGSITRPFGRVTLAGTPEPKHAYQAH